MKQFSKFDEYSEFSAAFQLRFSLFQVYRAILKECHHLIKKLLDQVISNLIVFTSFLKNFQFF